MSEGTVDLISREKCTGCGACDNSCPAKAITMNYDQEGFLYPVIDKAKCINCGKCHKVCPESNEQNILALLHEKGKCYAMMASDEIRAVSSSGGMFSVLAKYILNQGGIVAGAAYSDDCMTVNHIIIESNDDMYKLRSSKYVQSAINDSYTLVKKALNTGRKVLFTGCPCQVAGLYRFLGGDNNNLYTADIICHAANSVYAYQSYLSEISGGKTIRRIDFREKKNYGWITNLNIYYDDGTEYIEHPDKTKAQWYIGFLKGIINRRCCSSCHYTRFERVSDVTMGDFWKVTKINQDWNDKKGTSLVLVNTEKGAEITGQIKEDLKLWVETEIDYEFAKFANGQLVRPSKRHKGRDAFFRELPQIGYHKALKTALDSVNKSMMETTMKSALKRYDVGIVGYWWSSNYGSVITYYALYKIVESLGYSCILIDRPEKEKHTDGLDVFSRRFMEERLNCSESIGWNDLKKHNEYCSSFLLGSDQVWGPGAIKGYDFFFFLDFVNDGKNKIAYAASFGERFNVDDQKKDYAKACVRRFDHVSVREKSAVNICKDVFNVEAERVLDPVFLLDLKEYDSLASQAKNIIDVAKGDYIVSYILRPNEEVRSMLLEASNQLNMPLINMLHGKAHSFENNSKLLNLPNTIENLSEEQWIYYLKNAKYVITDSHHGAALCIIFNKQFICCSTHSWGLTRFDSLFGLFDIKDRMCTTKIDMLERKLLEEKIDYDRVNYILKYEKEYSLRWLSEALMNKSRLLNEKYSFLIEKINSLENRIKDLETVKGGK